MSRKVLYRAWDKKCKVMLEGFAIYSEGNEIGMSQSDAEEFYTEGQIEQDMGGHFGSGDDWLFILNDFELLQWAGLKDKNGKDIYEGDIIREPFKDEWDKTNFVSYEVFYHDNDMAAEHVGFQCNRTHYHGSLCGGSILMKFLPKYTSNMEIIGNIYENTELLKS